MAISTQRLRILRGNTAAASAFTGLQGELIFDTDLYTLRLQDGVTAGGYTLATTAQLANVSANANYGNTNVAAYLPTYTGNVNAGNINSTYIYGAQRIFSNAVIIGYGTNGSGLIGAPIIMSGNSTTSLIGTNGLANNVASNLIVRTLNSNISFQLTGVNKTWSFDTAGNLTIPGNISSSSNFSIDTSAESITLSANLSDWVFDETGVLTAPGEIETVGNITAGYFLGNGSQLTGLPATYSNVNVAAYLTSLANIKVGFAAGATNQGSSAVAVGPVAAASNQGNYAVAVGSTAGQTDQGRNAIAIGVGAGAAYQGVDAIAIGATAGGAFQGNGAVAIGSGAGGSSGSDLATVAIGQGATTGGNYAVSIGTNARGSNANTIIINATGSVLNSSGTGFYVDPISSSTSGNVLYYNTGTKQITYGAAPETYGNANVSAFLTYTFLPSYSGNISAGNIMVSGNLFIANSGNIIQQNFYGNTGNFYGDPTTGFGAFYAGKSGFTAVPQTLVQVSGNYNGYAQVNLENQNAGDQATADYIVTADNGTDSTYYVDLGIASSGYNGLVSNNSLGTSLYANDAYLYAQGNTNVSVGGNLVIGTTTNSKNIKFISGGSNTEHIAVQINHPNVGNTLQVTGGITTSNITFPDGTKTSGNTVTLANSASYYWQFNEPAGPISDNITLSFNSLTTEQGLWYFGTDNTANTWILNSGTKTINFSNNPGTTLGGRLTFGDAANISNGTANDIELTSVNANAYVRASNSIWKFDVYGNIRLPSNSSAILYPNGESILSGITGGAGNYSNANVASYLPIYTGNLSAANISLTNNTSALTFNTGAYIYGDTLSRPGSVVLQPNTSVAGFPSVVIGGAGRLAAPNGSVHAIFNTADLTVQVPLKATSATAATSTSTGALIVSGGAGIAGNVVASGNISGNFFIGNGALLTGIVASGSTYSNTNVAAYLTTYGGPINANIITGTANATVNGLAVNNSVTIGTTLGVTGNITAGNIIANQFGNSEGTTATYTANVTAGNLITSGTSGNITGANVISATTFVGNGSQLTGVATQVTGSWSLAAGANSVNINIATPGTFSMWVNGNIPNGIVTYTATVVVTNTNVPVLGSQSGWYYAAGGNLVLTSMPSQIVGNVGTISNASPAVSNAYVFSFGINNNSGTTQVVNWGYTKL